MAFNDGLDFARSYYLATAKPFASLPALTEEIEVDLAVVGGGCTGLSAALHAAQAGARVALVEGGRIGWGASGRNGGQMIPGLRKGAAGLVKAFGRERARALFDLAVGARSLVLGLIETHSIACDLKTTGHLQAAVKASDLARMEAEVRCLHEVMDWPHTTLLGPAEAGKVVATRYHGGLFDESGGHLHPLNYALGLAEAAAATGVTMFENSPATGLAKTAEGVRVVTSAGAVRARHAILAGDALLHGLDARVESRIMPVANYIIATAPLADPAALIPGDAAISDSRFVVNYYRLTADGRLLFGGGERYVPDPPADIAAFVRPYMEATFPAIAGVAIDHAWGGLVSITTSRLPHLGKAGPVLFAHGYSGMGVLFSTLAGELLVQSLYGEPTGLELLEEVEPVPFPGGRALRGPLHVLGMLWYALRDRL